MNKPLSLPLSPELFHSDDLQLAKLKQHVADFQQWLEQAFSANIAVSELLLARSNFLDQLLQRLWHEFQLDSIEELSLIAVGGYGRKELHPLSDIDLLILSQQPLAEVQSAQVGQFITLLWDLHLMLATAFAR